MSDEEFHGDDDVDDEEAGSMNAAEMECTSVLVGDVKKETGESMLDRPSDLRIRVHLKALKKKHQKKGSSKKKK